LCKVINPGIVEGIDLISLDVLKMMLKGSFDEIIILMLLLDYKSTEFSVFFLFGVDKRNIGKKRKETQK